MIEVNFKTNALLKNIIGKDLITDDNIAVLELVKNSFDAGSPKVDIEFKNLVTNDDHEITETPTNNTSKLIIQDLGVGMNSSDLINKWLNIAYSEKKEDQEQFGRILAGNKGVGRFSCDRLGKLLTIYTRKDNGDYYKLFIDWRKFEIEGQQDFKIQDVKLEIDNIPSSLFSVKTGLPSFNKGTILEINLLREYWSPDKIVSLKRELEKLINPNQSFTHTPFQIFLSATDYLDYDKNVHEEGKKINGEVKNKIFEKLDFKTTSIHAKIDESGSYITTSLQDRGSEIFCLEEINTFDQLRNIEITVYYLNPYAKMYFTKQTGIRSVNFGSIFLFINGFRIPPYGDDGDDWLGLEIRKGQGYNRFLGTREIVGRIEISGNKDLFKIISNRSGVVNNAAFQQLTKSTAPYGLFYKIFRRLEKFVVDGIKWDKVDKNIDERSILDKVDEKYLIDDFTRSKQILSVINKIIDIKEDDIISLNINDEFVGNIIDEQAEKAAQELDLIINELANRTQETDPNTILKFQKILANNSQELDGLLNLIGKLNSPFKITSNVARLNSVKEDINHKQDDLNALKRRLEEEIAIREKTEEEKKKIEIELELEREKNTYLRTSSRALSEDAKGLVHNIKITSKKISASVSNLYDKILSGSTIKHADMLKTLGAIKFQAEKAMKISKIITRSNFKTDQTDQIVDIVKYINQYISIYKDIYEESELAFNVIIPNNTSLIRKISVLEMAVIFDDLISNSEKAGAQNIKFTMQNINNNSLKIIISDDGKGVDEKFLNAPFKIFELGITTTNGSGIGLNSVKTALRTMKADISFLGNNVDLKGAAFEIIFR